MKKKKIKIKGSDKTIWGNYAQRYKHGHAGRSGTRFFCVSFSIQNEVNMGEARDELIEVGGKRQVERNIICGVRDRPMRCAVARKKVHFLLQSSPNVAFFLKGKGGLWPILVHFCSSTPPSAPSQEKSWLRTWRKQDKD